MNESSEACFSVTPEQVPGLGGAGETRQAYGNSPQSQGVSAALTSIGEQRQAFVVPRSGESGIGQVSQYWHFV